LRADKGASVELAKENLTEAVGLFLETADASEVLRRTHSEANVTGFEVSVGYAKNPFRKGACTVYRRLEASGQ